MTEMMGVLTDEVNQDFANGNRSTSAELLEVGNTLQHLVAVLHLRLPRGPGRVYEVGIGLNNECRVDPAWISIEPVDLMAADHVLAPLLLNAGEMADKAEQ